MTSGETLTVALGATVSATTVAVGGVLLVSGSDFGATVSGTETVFGSASGGKIYGSALVSGVVSGESVMSGGSLAVTGAGASGTSTTVSFGGNETVANGGVISGDMIYGSVSAGGATVTVSAATVESGGLLFVDSSTQDVGTTILAGGNETVYGSATGDQIYGTQLVSGGADSTAVVTSETVYAGGNLDLFLKDGVASGTTVLSGGALNINGKAFASNTVLSGGGLLELQSPKAQVTGTLTFEGGGNDLAITGVTSSGLAAWAATISGFSQTDKIDITSSAFAASGMTLSQSTSGGNTVADVISGGATVEAFTFAGTTLNGDLSLVTDGNGGLNLEITPLPVTTSITTSTASGAFTETTNNTLLVLGGGSVTGATIEANANLVVNGGADVSATILSGALETISAGSASGDQIYGSVVVSAGGVSNETVQSGGQLTVDPGTASNTLLNGGATLDLTGPDATLSGSLTFANGDNTLLVSALSNPGAGDQAVISGFSTSDKIDISGISPGASIGYAAGANNTEIVTVSGTGGSESFTFNNQTTYGPGTMAVYSDGGSGVDLVEKTTPVVTFTSLNNLTTNQATEIVNGTVNVAVDPEAIGTVVTVDEGNNAVGTATVQANGYWSANVTFQNDSGANVLTATDTDLAGQTGVTATSLTTNVNTAAAAFTAGDLVVSVYGDGSGTGNYTLDQAAPISLDQITTSGTIASQTVLPETTSTVNGVTEYLISGEYGSASEGALQLSADGHSLTIVGYGVNYQAFDASNSAATYGNAALGQSITLTSDTAVTLVPRVVADINASGVIDTSTALYNIYYSNNPRSVATVNGTAFYLSGQGVKGSTNQGVFYAADGASSATAISTATDTRIAEIYNGQLYVRADSTQGATNITDYGSVGTVTSSATATPVVLNGLGPTVTLGGGNGNAINGSTGTVNLSPESFFFANATTLYVADGGLPKNGGVGDGGLQKWVENAATGTWTLEYTLSAGLNLQNSTTALSGVSGLFGLTGQVVNGQVQLFASSSTIGELDQSYLYSITDSLTSTTGTGESFSTVLAASSNEIIRGVSFAPTASSTPCYCAGTLILTDRGEVAVENLAIGDHVKTLGGDAKPIKWIGTRSYDGRFVGANREILPICVRAGALDENKPSRDLWVSPHHALYLEGVLIEAKDLVNGASIVQAEKIERVDYFHIELFNHDVMFAEGAAAESFIDNDSRAMFQNVADYFALYSDSGHKKRKTPSFAPRRDEGFEIEAARKSIETRAGIVTTSTPGALHGWVEGMSSEGLWGWAQDSSDPQNPVCLHVYADDCVIGRVLANRFRPDLMEAGLGFGRHAFRFEAPKGVDFSKVRIELRRASDGAPLPCPAQCAA